MNIFVHGMRYSRDHIHEDLLLTIIENRLLQLVKKLDVISLYTTHIRNNSLRTNIGSVVLHQVTRY
jgi:hypothetical protein